MQFIVDNFWTLAFIAALLGIWNVVVTRAKDGTVTKIGARFNTDRAKELGSNVVKVISSHVIVEKKEEEKVEEKKAASSK